MTVPALHRPSPLDARKASSVDAQVPPEAAARRLLDGEPLLVSDRYRTGLEILDALQRLMGAPPDDAPYARRRAFRTAYEEAAGRLMVRIVDHAIALDASPAIGFLRQLYPEPKAFALSFPDVNRLHNAWRVYDEGVHLAVLGQRLHPLYGTYVPSRTTHLELFATWLSQYQGPRDRATDVGTGCGVLAFLLAKAGFAEVRAVDSNPNAVESVRRELQRLPAPPPIQPIDGDLLAAPTQPADLIVFNPPWTKGRADDLLARALVYEDGLFERFFQQAHEALSASGRVVLVFSNLIRLVQPEVPHPIDAELEHGGRFRLVQCMPRKVKAGTTRDGRRRNTKERVEIWELAKR